MKITSFVQNQKLMDSLLSAEDEKKSGALSFQDTLKEKLQEVNELQIASEQMTESFIKGEDISIHELMLTTEEAKLSLQLAVQIRNKLLEAYQEINRLQL